MEPVESSGVAWASEGCLSTCLLGREAARTDRRDFLDRQTLELTDSPNALAKIILTINCKCRWGFGVLGFWGFVFVFVYKMCDIFRNTFI